MKLIRSKNSRRVNDAPRPSTEGDAWVVLSVDDEPAVHEITRLILMDFLFAGKSVELLSANSGQEAQDIISQRNDIALVLLDVVMESDDAGLNAVHFIRDSLLNHYTRIILRTGQPGMAPRTEVIEAYDIDGYVEKNEMIRERLFGLLYSSLRAYRDLCTIQDTRYGMERVIETIAQINDTTDIDRFATILLQSMQHLIDPHYHNRLLQQPELYISSHIEKNQSLISARQLADRVIVARDGDIDLDPFLEQMIGKAFSQQKGFKVNDYFLCYHQSARGSETVLCLHAFYSLTAQEERLLRVLSTNVSLTMENLIRKQEVTAARSTLIHILGEAVETRSKETGAHVRRVGEYSAILAEASGLPQEQVELIRNAAPLHDVGKIAVPDHILNKPAKFNAEEWEVMKQHSQRGEELLSGYRHDILELAAIIAGQHHEKWNGCGYPKGLKGNKIHIAAQLTGIADVYDALCSVRVYKNAYSPEDALAMIIKESGQSFKPDLVELFSGVYPQIRAVQRRLPD